MRSAVLLFATLLLVSCTPELPEGRFACSVDSECPSDWTCDTGANRCVSHLADAGQQDAGCELGYEPSADGCVDINECLAQGICGPSGTCANSYPGYSCTCGTGYAVPAGEKACAEVDECRRGLDNCSFHDTCTNTVGAFTCSCTYSCGWPTIASDSDTGVTPWMTWNSLTTATDGMDLDTIDNSPVPSGIGRTIEGCGVPDPSGGFDNAFGTLAVTLKQAGMDLDKDMNDSLTANGGSLLIEFRLTHLAAANVADEAVVGFEIRVGGASGIVYQGAGSLSGHTLIADLWSDFEVDFPLNTPPSSCNNGTCNAGAKLTIRIRNPHLRVLLDSANTAIQPDSILAGTLFFEDTATGYTSLNQTGFKAALTQWMTDVNLANGLRGTVTDTFQGARDLHLETSGYLGHCSSPTNELTNTNRNSISTALEITSP